MVTEVPPECKSLAQLKANFIMPEGFVKIHPRNHISSIFAEENNNRSILGIYSPATGFVERSISTVKSTYKFNGKEFWESKFSCNIGVDFTAFNTHPMSDRIAKRLSGMVVPNPSDGSSTYAFYSKQDAKTHLMMSMVLVFGSNCVLFPSVLQKWIMSPKNNPSGASVVPCCPQGYVTRDGHPLFYFVRVMKPKDDVPTFYVAFPDPTGTGKSKTLVLFHWS
jgi:hypothetical protein